MTVVDKVYSETDYSKFKILQGNRDVVEMRKKKILNSIKKVGYILNPIIVNKKMEIIDGQGRYMACQELGLPIIYVMDKNAGIDECIAMNQGQVNWKAIDWVKMYADNGNENYKRLLKLMIKYKELTLETVLGIANNKIIIGGFANAVVKTGEVCLSEEDFEKADEILSIVKSVNTVLDAIPGNSRGKKTAFAWCLRNTDCDQKRLVSVLVDNYPIISPVIESRVEFFMIQLSDLYNKRLQSKKCIYFETEYKKWLKEN